MKDTLPVYLGYDPREAVGTYVFMNSAMRRSSAPLSFHPLALTNLRGYDDRSSKGTNDFIRSRFLIPYLQNYTGFALFVDGADMLVRGDLAELWSLRDPVRTAVQVVPHEYKTKYPRKYLGTSMESDNVDYPKKNQSSVMLINCAHFAWRQITPESLSLMDEQQLHRFEFMPEDAIKHLPPEWNVLVGEQPYNPNAKLCHWTLGVPGMDAYANTDYADEWFDELKRATYVVPSVPVGSRPAVFKSAVSV